MWSKPQVEREIVATRKRMGAEIRRLRKKLELNQEALAERAGLHANYVSRIENGAVNASLAAIVALAIGLETTPKALFR